MANASNNTTSTTTTTREIGEAPESFTKVEHLEQWAAAKVAYEEAKKCFDAWNNALKATIKAAEAKQESPEGLTIEFTPRVDKTHGETLVTRTARLMVGRRWCIVHEVREQFGTTKAEIEAFYGKGAYDAAAVVKMRESFMAEITK